MTRRAVDEILARLQRIEARMTPDPGPNPKLRDLADAYFRHLAAQACVAYVYQRRTTIESIFGWHVFGEHPTRFHADPIVAETVADLTPALVEDYLARRIAAGASRRTVAMDQSVLLTMLRWAVRTKRISTNPLDGMTKFKVTEADRRKRRRALSDAEIGAFLRAADADDAQLRDRVLAKRTIANGTKGRTWRGRGRRPGIPPLPQAPLWRFLVERGSRAGETSKLRWADVDLDAMTATFRAETTKTRRGRTVPLTPGVIAVLRELRAQHAVVLDRDPGPEDRVFLRPYGKPWTTTGAGPGSLLRAFRRIARLAGLPLLDTRGRSLDVHALRGTAATRMLRNGIPVDLVMDVGGWTSSEVLRSHYRDLRLEDAQRALAGLPDIPCGGGG